MERPASPCGTTRWSPHRRYLLELSSHLPIGRLVAPIGPHDAIHVQVDVTAMQEQQAAQDTLMLHPSILQHLAGVPVADGDRGLDAIDWGRIEQVVDEHTGRL